jgi:hypothetical protein
MNCERSTFDFRDLPCASIWPFIPAGNPRDPIGERQFSILTIDANDINSSLLAGASQCQPVGITGLWHQPRSYEDTGSSSIPEEKSNYPCLFEMNQYPRPARQLYGQISNYLARYLTSNIWPAAEEISYEHFQAAFQRATEEAFESGMESKFSQELERLTWLAPEFAESALGGLLSDAGISQDVIAEALRWIGRSGGALSNASKLRLLESALDSSRVIVRDSAALGLASLNDPGAITRLESAISSETVDELRADFEHVVTQLRNAIPCNAY